MPFPANVPRPLRGLLLYFASKGMGPSARPTDRRAKKNPAHAGAGSRFPPRGQRRSRQAYSACSSSLALRFFCAGAVAGGGVSITAGVVAFSTGTSR